ncbi:hypothetical protein EVG20_g11464 [Dentipellis fragilis]|uniref:Reverse transcriptase Ty1/copia-type domain-containing protein n=1 Tax=Dentipellis fragilis TaxID=205917 RepID=A0A4Y9XMG5_9AGAM|nr:hypothetical protein EVG20_g11464 [Dentipellis fragilis]
MMCGAAVSWSSKKQPSTALSSTEAEYIMGAHAAKEAIWLRGFLAELWQPRSGPTILLMDNQSAMVIAWNPAFHARMKHIDVRHHFLHEKVKEGILDLEYIPTGEQVADVLTKGLPREKHKHFCEAMGLRCTG